MNTPFSFLSFYAKERRWLFWILLILLLLSTGWGFYFYLNPFAVTPSFSPLPHYEEEVVTTGQVETPYRTIPEQHTAFYTFVAYASSFISPQKFPLLVGTVGLIFLWTWLLSLASRFQSLLAFSLYFLFGSFIYQIQPSSLFLPQPNLWVDLICFLLLILPSFLVRVHYFLWETEFLLVLYFLLFSALASGYYFQEGWIGLHAFVTQPLLSILFLALLFTILTAPALSFSLLSLSTSQIPSLRLGGRLFFLLYGIFSISNLVVDLRLVNSPSLFPLPFILFFLSLFLAPFLYQPFFYQNRSVFHSHFSFIAFFLATGVGLNLIIGTYWSTGEYLLTRLLDRILLEEHAFLFLATLLYLFVNFRFRLPRDQESLLSGTAFAFYHLFFLTMVFLTFMEGREKWRTIHIALCNHANAQADHFLLLRDYKQAYSQYQFSLHWAKNDPKANYNSGIAWMQIHESTSSRAVDFLFRSLYLKPWAHATLNLAHVYWQRGNTKKAQETILRLPNWSEHPELVSTLAYFAFQDSAYETALSYLKQSRRPNPILFSNICALYLKNNRLKPAKEAIEIATELNPDDPNIAINRIFLFFKDSSYRSPHLDVWNPEDSLNFLLSYQTALYWYSRGEYEKVIRRLEPFFPQLNPHVISLYLFSVGKVGGLEKALSLYRLYSESASSDFKAAELHRTMARLYVAYDMPEMAKDLFFRGQDSLYGWLLTLDAGFHEQGIRGLLAYATRHASDYLEIRKDEAMLYRAHKDYESAAFTWSFQNMSRTEYFRQARYAYQANNPELLFDVLSEYIDKKDSTHYYPYYLATLYDFSIGEFRRARESLQLGIQRANAKASLVNLLGYLYLLSDQTDSLKALLTQWEGTYPWYFLFSHYMQSFQTTASDSLIQQSQNSHYEEAWGIATGYALTKTKRFDLLQKLFYHLTEINPNNPWYWHFLSIAYKELNMEEDYRYCREQLSKTLPDFHPLRFATASHF